MKHLFLASSAADTLPLIKPLLQKPADELSLAFIATAADLYEDKWWVEKDRQALLDFGFQLQDLNLQDEAFSEKLQRTDGIFIAGGNTIYLLEKAQQAEVIDLIRQQVLKEEKLYVGSSAGSVIAGPDISLERHFEDREDAPVLDSYKGFNLVNFIVQPHWASETWKEEYLPHIHHFYDVTHPIVTLTDKHAVRVKGKVMEVMEID